MNDGIAHLPAFQSAADACCRVQERSEICPGAQRNWNRIDNTMTLAGILVTAGETRTSDGPPSAAELRARKVSDADPSFHRGRLCVGMTRSEPAISHSLYGPV